MKLPKTVLLFAGLVAAFAARADALLGPHVGWWRETPGEGSVGLRQSFENLGEDRFRLVMFYGRPPAGQRVVEGRCDGKAYPHKDGTGKPVGTTFSCRMKDARTMEYEYTQPDSREWVTSTGTQTVSEDGKVMELNAVHRDADGKFVANLHRHFDRQPAPQ